MVAAASESNTHLIRNKAEQSKDVQKMGSRKLPVLLAFVLLFLLVLECSIGCELVSSIFGIIVSSFILLLSIIACYNPNPNEVYPFIMAIGMIFGTIRLGWIVGYTFRIKDYEMGRMLADQCYAIPGGLFAIDTTVIGLLVFVSWILQ